MLETLRALFIFLSGAVVGSFLGVCVYRIPRAGLSPLFPLFSLCHHCQKGIGWYDNIPIVSFVILKGRCRYCGASISCGALVLEVATGLIALATFLRLGFCPAAVWQFVFFSTLLVIAWIDLERMLIPDLLSVGGTLVALGVAPLVGQVSFGDSLAGALGGGAVIVLINTLYKRVTHRDGFGLGDAKLLAFVGAALGWQALLVVIFLSSFLGSVFGLLVWLFHKRDIWRRQMPFAPFVALAAIAHPFCEKVLWRLWGF